MSDIAAKGFLPEASERISLRVIVAVLALATVAGLGIALLNAPLVAVAVAGALAMIVAVAAVPPAGAWVWLLLGPLIIGIARGEATIPPFRPNEVLLLVAVIGVGLRGLWHISRGERFFPKFQPLDGAMILLLLTGSILPLLVRYGRGLPFTEDDILYSFVFWKYFALYLMFRIGVRTPAQVALCLRLALVSGAVVAVVAVLQVKDLLGVNQFLNAYYDSPFEASVGVSTTRGSSTIASSFGLGDMMAMCLAVTLTMLVHASRNRGRLIAGGLLFLAGCVAAGSFSGIIGLGIVILAVGYVTRRLTALLAVAVPTILLSSAVFWPIIANRLDGFNSRTALPRSWVGRWENLERFFWPEVFSGFNWLWGVRPAARVAAPETWRNWVFIESGHTWFLWVGGLPLLAAYFFFTWVVARDLFRIARADRGPVGVAASAGLAATAMIFVVSLFDPHLTVRGSADLFFPLLALALVGRGAAPVMRAKYRPRATSIEATQRQGRSTS